MENNKRTHTVECKSREILKADTVNKIEYLSPEAVLLSTAFGRMSVKGNGLYVENLDKATGEIIIKGHISSITYHEKDENNKWLKRMFG